MVRRIGLEVLLLPRTYRRPKCRNMFIPRMRGFTRLVVYVWYLVIERCVLHPPVSTYTARSLELVKEIGPRCTTGTA